jgi:hypothetical protein
LVPIQTTLAKFVESTRTSFVSFTGLKEPNVEAQLESGVVPSTTWEISYSLAMETASEAILQLLCSHCNTCKNMAPTVMMLSGLDFLILR